MKKVMSLAMTTVMAAVALAGCGSSGSTTATTAAAAAEESTAAAGETTAAAEAEDAAVSGKTYKIAIDQAFAPFSIQQDDGSYVGIDVEIIKAVADAEGFDVDIQPMDFSAIIPALTSGTIDGGLGCMSVTDERKQSVDFSDPYYEDGLALVTAASDDSISALTDLKDKTIAVKEGTQGALWAEDNQAEYGFEISTLQDSASIAMAVKNGQADAMLEDYPVIAYEIKIGEQEGLKVAVDAVNEPGPVAFAVNKGANADLLKAFNDGLAKIKADGTYDSILAEYAD